MANLDITIKRKNGAGYDVLYPTTIVAQVEGLQTALDAKLNTSARGAANGVASLDANSKIPVAQLPNAVFDSLYFVTGISSATPTTAYNLLLNNVGYGDFINDIYQLTVSAVTVPRSAVGLYWVVATTQKFKTNVITPVQRSLGGGASNLWYTYGFVTTEPDVDANQDFTLESGDWFVITRVSGGDGSTSALAINYELQIVNNTYENATDTLDGIVRLSSSTSTATTGNAVVTNGILNGLLATANTNLNGTTNANKLAPAAHHHNSEYLGISSNAVSASKWANARTITLGGDLTGSVSIDGSANVTLNAEVSNDSHTHAFANITSKPTTLSGYGITDAVLANTAITGATKTKITFDAKGLVTAGADLVAADIPNLDTAKITTGTFAIARIPTGTTSSTVALGNHTHTFASLTSKPTTLSGYGITDAASTSDLTNRPEIYYNASANSDGDLVLDLDSDGAVA
jgi:hypothetical protein